MKMAVHAKFFLVLMGLALLGACGSDTDEDLTTPKLTMDAVASSTFTKQRTLTGQVEAGTGIEIDVSTDAKVGEILIREDGTWEAEIADLEVGSNLVTVSADDSHGNTSSLQFILEYNIFIIDQVDTITMQPSSTVYGRLAPGASITSVTLNGAPVTLPANGETFSLSLDGLAEGTNKVTITAQDAAADTQTSTLNIVRDVTAISLTIDKPSIPISAHSLQLIGTVGGGGTVAVSVESEEASVGEVVYPTTTSWQVTIENLEERSSRINVSAAQEGKATASAWTRVVVESLPEVVETEPANGATASPDTLVKATFSEAVVASRITFQIEDALGNPVPGEVAYNAADNSIIFTPADPLAPGSYTASVSGVEDPEENPVTNPELLTWSFTVL